MKRTIVNLVMCTLCICTFPVFATRYHVNILNGDDENDGLLWSTAFKNLQTAIDAAEEGDEIWIAAGVYHPTTKMADVYGSLGNESTPTNDRHRSFLIRKNIALYGGFPENPSDATDMGSRNWREHQTVLSGDFNGDDGNNFEHMDENAYHVVVLFDAAPSLVLDGFFITGGNADDINNVYAPNNYYYVTGSFGGGLYAYTPSMVDVASPTLTNISFYGNCALTAGAMYIHAFQNDAAPKLTNVSIVHNKAKNGNAGGLYVECAGVNHAELVNINVVGNEANKYGGGLYFTAIEECSPSIINTVVSGNYSKTSNGGGIMIRTINDGGDAKPTIINSTICGNKSFSDGGGLVIYPEGISKANIYNTVVWGNKGNDYDNFYAEGTWGKANTIKGSFIAGYDDADPTNLPGNTDPLFLDPVLADFAPTMDGDYQLTLGSPLINKGINAYITIPNDLLDNFRIYDGTVDIGAYESQGHVPKFNETIADEKTVWSNSGYLYVRTNQTTALHVYALDGSLVKHISNLGEGIYEFALPRGFYIVTLSNGITEKIVIR